MSHKEFRPDRAGHTDHVGQHAGQVDAPRVAGADHTPRCLCGCAVATYSIEDIAAPAAPELRGRAA